MDARIHYWVADPHERVYPDTPPQACSDLKFRLARNEFHAGQILVRCAKPIQGLRLIQETSTDLEDKQLPAEWLKWRVVGYVKVPETGLLTPDPLFEYKKLDVPANFSQSLWITVRVPLSAEVGRYFGYLELLKDDNQKFGRVKIIVEVLAFQLPDGPNLRFNLNLWQHPSTLAYYYGVPLWSEEHWRIIKNYLLDLALTGQKVVLTTIVEGPWRYTEQSIQRSMVKWTRQVTGTFNFDFSVFDRYVETALDVGIKSQIHAYSPRQFMCPDGITVGFYNEEDGRYEEEYLVIGTDKYRFYWGAFLKAFENHLIEKGWLEKTYLGIDEPESEKPFHTMLAFIKEIAPGLKITSALNKAEMARFLPGNLKSISFALGQVDAEFIREFKEADLETTYYVCCIPEKPNTFLTSPPLEARILPWLAWQQKLDGLLRWSYAFWPSLSDGSYDPFNYLRWDFPRNWDFWPWPSGDMFLVYPGPEGCPISSIRLEMLRLGIQDYEYLALLRDRLAEVGQVQAVQIEEGVNSALKLVVRDFQDYTSSIKDIENARTFISNILSNNNNP